MAQIMVAGPAEIHVSTSSGGQLSFLGWSERGVRITDNAEWDDVPADLAGSRMPADVQCMGEQGYVSLDLKIWNAAVWRAITARWNPASGTPGKMPAGTIGKLMVAEGAAYRLLVYPPYMAKPAFQGSVLPYNFFKAWLAGPDTIDPFGTKAMKVRCIFRAIAAYNSQNGDWDLYNNDATGKPAAL